jgi:putative transposase
MVLAVREKRPTWGAKKIAAFLITNDAGFRVPSPTTIDNIMNRNHVVRRRQQRKTYTPYPPPLHVARAPNDLWCADFKGQFKLGSGRYCYPLTITDRFSRLVICCEALENTKAGPAMVAFERAFRDYGLPKMIRTDNGTPFAGPGLWALTRLSARWLRLGIWPERIAPGHPEQNGQHERMHLVLKQETTRPPGANFLQQQERFDRFCSVYNNERPHEALGQRPPSSIYTRSPRELPRKLRDPEYPLHDQALRVHGNGDLWLSKNDVFRVTSALGGQVVGVREVEVGRVLISFTDYDLGHYDFTTKRFTPNALPSTKEQQGSAEPASAS